MLLIAYGTRPEWLKIKPVVDELKKKRVKFKTVFTGQHKDLVTDTSPDFIFDIDVYHQVDRLNLIMISCLKRTASLLATNSDIKFVMVQGDTTSALGVAMAAYNVGIEVIHLEAGLRTYDLNNPFPEEANRQLISRIASIHLCPTRNNSVNLEHDRVGGSKFIVGNTGLDNLREYIVKCEYDDIVLVTLHRRENHEIISEWFNTINKIAIKYPTHKFILPIHPNPNVKKYVNILKNVNVVEPLSHKDLLNILVKCKFVITDSGGLQEECSFLGKKAIVCRKETERPEAIGHTTQLCESPEELMEMVREMMINYEIHYEHACPFGDGYSAQKIVKLFKDIL